MTGYLLDTNIISELRKPKPHVGVLRWVRGLREEQIFLSAITIGELQRGIERTRRQDSVKAREIEDWLDRLEESISVIPMDGRCFREWARLMERKSSHLLEDAMIAATAHVHSLTVATRNIRDFVTFNIATINPFQTSD